MNIKHDYETEMVQQLSIEIKKDDYSEKVETGLKKYRKTAQIPGFRVGNAPVGLIKKNYELPLIADEVNKMTNDALYDYFEKNKIEVMFEPMLIDEKSTVDFEKHEDFVFTFEFAVQPKFELDFNSLPLIKSFSIKASASEIEDYMNQIRKRHGDYINPETVENDDYINVKWGDEKDGFFFIKDLTEASKTLFIEKKMGDSVTVSLKDLFVSEESLKKFLKKTETNLEESDFGEVEFGEVELTITSIGRVLLAEMNEEFFKKAFPDGSVTTVEQFEQIGAQQIESQWKQETDRKFMNDSITMLVNNVPIQFPEDFVKRYILKNNAEITVEKLAEEWTKYAESFKWQLIEGKLGKENKLEVTIEEIKAHIRHFYYQNYFMQFNLEDVEAQLNKLVEDAVKDKKQVKQLYDQLFDLKVMQTLQNKLNTEELTGDFNQFIAFLTGKSAAENIIPAETEKVKKTRRSPAKKKTE